MKATFFSWKPELVSGCFKGKFLGIWGLFLVLTIGGCQQPPEVNSEGKKVVLTTFTVLADITQNVAGDQAIAESLVKTGAEIHGYEPTPSDLVKAQKADLILDNGFGLERWADRFFSNLKNVPRVTVSEGIEPINISEDAYKGKPNPHAWMSPKNALIYVENIREALVELDPENAEIYNRNAQEYSEEIKQLDQELQATIQVIPPENGVNLTNLNSKLSLRDGVFVTNQPFLLFKISHP
jgi:manganese transport system substrate-binding protein